MIFVLFFCYLKREQQIYYQIELLRLERETRSTYFVYMQQVCHPDGSGISVGATMKQIFQNFIVIFFKLLGTQRTRFPSTESNYYFFNYNYIFFKGLKIQ